MDYRKNDNCFHKDHGESLFGHYLNKERTECTIYNDGITYKVLSGDLATEKEWLFDKIYLRLM